MPPLRMQLKILLPSRVFSVLENVTSIVAEARQGSFGLLPQRLDCVAALAPGILTYATEATGEVYLAVDEGVLVKTGTQVVVSVRHAIGGADLGQLRQAVERDFVTMDEHRKPCEPPWRNWKAGSFDASRSFIMSDEPRTTSESRDAAFQQKVAIAEERKLKAKRGGVQGIWMGLGTFGTPSAGRWPFRPFWASCSASISTHTFPESIRGPFLYSSLAFFSVA